MSDERFEAWLKDAAQDYNRPPDIAPREQMWEAIQAGGRRAEVGGSRTARTWSLAAAAVLLLAAGIGVGYWARGANAPATMGRIDSVGQAVAQGERAANTQTSLSPTPSALGARRSALEDSTPTGYDVLAAQHFTAAEALLVSFRASTDTTMDDLMRRWSRDLLSTTRLLLDSPTAGDAQRRRLLEDLEVVLVQLSQLPSRDATLDRELVNRAIARREVLTRIRTSIPAGFTSGS